MKEVIIAINTLVFIGLIVFVAYILYGIVMMNIVFGGKCGLAAGPYYGNKIEINPDIKYKVIFHPYLYHYAIITPN